MNDNIVVKILRYNPLRNEYEVQLSDRTVRFDPFVCCVETPENAGRWVGKMVRVIDYFYTTTVDGRVLLCGGMEPANDKP